MTEGNNEQQVYAQIGMMTRNLHETLRALGHDKALEKTVGAIPDARERLAYVLNLTEQSVSRVLNSVEALTPVQDRTEQEAVALLQAWEQASSARRSSRLYQDTLQRTQQFLTQVEQDSHSSRAHLTEILMAQEFQDLTGQVIKKIVDLAQDMETQLLALLAISAPPAPQGSPAGEAPGLMNGPAMASQKAGGQVLASQDEVDNFLDSLGF